MPFNTLYHPPLCFGTKYFEGQNCLIFIGVLAKGREKGKEMVVGSGALEDKFTNVTFRLAVQRCLLTV